VSEVLTVESPAMIRKDFGKVPRVIVAGGIALVIALLGIVWIVSPRLSETTDNAYVKADTTAVAARVGGLVATVFVGDNQAVRAGDRLVGLDSEEFGARLAAAEASLADALAGAATARAALAGLGSEQALAAARVRATQSAIQSADAEHQRASVDRARFESLDARGFVTRRDAERVYATAISAGSSAEKSRADRAVAQQQAAVTRARQPVLVAELAKAQADVSGARAAVDLARQDMQHTLVRAPIDGIVGNRQVQPGDFVQPGSRLLVLVPSRDLYVVANFKETQTRNMLVGQPVTVDVDALGGKALHGRIQSFAPASGSEFTLLPFEPGSGNFTKIVQRVGVRIKLDADQPRIKRLRPGLSATVKVSLR
jgi:membrane fusion protein, multidrug efflux system